MFRRAIAQSRRWSSSNATSGSALPPRMLSVAYFTGNADLNDLRYRIRTLVSAKTNTLLPISDETAKVFKARDIMQLETGLRLSLDEYDLLVRDLSALYPLRDEPEVASLLEIFLSKQREQQTLSFLENIKLDGYGRSFARGGRKTSNASVWVLPGDGEIRVNGFLVGKYFLKREAENVLYPLQVTQSLGRFNVWGVVHGGGATGQSESIANGIAKALLAHNAAWRQPLDAVGLLQRDPRMVERKKPGQAKARKKFTWYAVVHSSMLFSHLTLLQGQAIG